VKEYAIFPEPEQKKQEKIFILKEIDI